jgi:amino acid adenylation domain-containing protein/non-ribosomal peptide synthase protein (TIGR01720 family)
MTVSSKSENIIRKPDALYSDDLVVFSASYAQRRMWFLDQFEPGSPYYNIPIALKIKGKLELKNLLRAFDEVIKRQESLRTRFKTINGEPVQVISDWMKLNIPIVMLENNSELENEIISMATAEARQPFNLENGPLLRIKILKIDENNHVILITMHHIISDGWSVGIFVKEICTLYESLKNGNSSPLNELEFQYADYSEWQKQFIEGGFLNSQLEYWKKKFADKPQPLELPIDRSRPAVWTNEGSTSSILLDTKLVKRINEMNQVFGSTTYMTLLSAFYVLLYKYSGQSDICVGTPIANRQRSELENIIGLFINTLVIRVLIQDGINFEELIREVRRISLEAYENQDLPFEMMVEAVQPERDMSSPPLFRVMFILQNIPVKGKMISGIELNEINVDMGTSTFDLTFSLSELQDQIEVSVEYNSDLYDRGTIERMLNHYRNIISKLIHEPEKKIESLDVFDEKEWNKIIYDWNSVQKKIPENIGIHKLFESTIKENPETVAVVLNNQKITYDELNKEANRFAHKISQNGVSSGSIIAIMLNKSFDTMKALLGVLKAGCTYLPVDPLYPEERIQHMLDDSKAEVIITSVLFKELIEDFKGKVIFVEEVTDGSTENPEVEITSNDIAYLIYTSGSTGKSKGTLVSHSSLVNAYYAWEDSYNLRTECKRHLQLASFAFDVFTGDWVRALCSGGSLILVPRDILLEAEQLYELMKHHQIEIAEFVPAVLRNLATYLESNKLKLNFMKLLIAGSDIWYVGEYKRFRKICGKQTRLVNSFGLTEATIDTCFYENTKIDLPDDVLVPIGKPFSNMTMYILDKNLNPVAPGVRAELFVGGEGVAEGYLNRADLTAEKFIPDPFSRTSGKRLYRTGDAACYLPDGTVQFLGRIDNQIKIRGFRVELGEIENALTEHPKISQAVVLAKFRDALEKILTAYLVTNEPEKIEINEIKHFLSKKLADYMIPAAYVFLESFPLTPNGKIDRKALPDPDFADVQRELDKTFITPRNQNEEKISEIWCKVLHLEKAGVTHNFFELGGHSLLATQVISRMKNEFKINIPLRTIFEKPTIEGLAAEVERLIISGSAETAPPIIPVKRTEDIPLSFAQQRLWFLDQLEPDQPFYNIPEAYRISGDLDVNLLEAAFNKVIERHEILRTSIITSNGLPVQKISEKISIKIPYDDISGFRQSEKEKIEKQLIEHEAKQIINLDSAPLFRIKVVKTDEDEFIVFLTMHHIISDDWSMQIMMQEVGSIYTSLSKNIKINLPQLPVQYADYSYWQRNWLSGEVLSSHLRFWKEYLSDIPPLLDLPTDYPRPSEQTFSGDFRIIRLSDELTNSIKKFAKEQNVTLYMTLLAAFQVLMHRYSCSKIIPTGTPIANRNRAETENLIGFFVNTLVIKSDFSKDPDFKQLVDQVHKNTVNVYSYQDLPFEQIVDAVNPERNMSHSPLFQVMFVLQNTPDREMLLSSEIRINAIESHSKTSKFDLTLFMQEEGSKLSGAFEFNTDLFLPSTIERMANHFKNILQDAIANSEKPVSKLKLLSDIEESSMIRELNIFASISKESRFVHKLFEEQAKKNPANIALRFDSDFISYCELNNRANQLAHYLIDCGAGNDTIIALCVNRSFETIVSLFAILKAGSAYLPLDSSHPQNRLEFMIEDCAIKILITDSENIGKFEKYSNDLRLININSLSFDKKNSNDPDVDLNEENLCYVIYTSGSTGKPKGTAITHKGLTNYLNWCGFAYPVNSGNGSIFHSTLSFDATVTSIYPSLVSGKMVRIIPEGIELEALSQYLIEEGNYSLIKITPAHLEMLSLQLPKTSQKVFTHSLVIGGENLNASQIEYWKKYQPETLLFNEYGPTETVVGCVVFEASRWNGERSVPIGKVIPGTIIYILDKNLNHVPQGVQGELFIGGEGVARCYINRADMTAEKFIPDPYSMNPGERMYRTGDLVKLLGDGNIEFIGRTDSQIKIKGYRIELGEIENVLSSFDGVVNAAVIVPKDSNAVSRLVAYYDTESKEPVEENLIKTFLQAKLPEYMRPSIVYFLESLPLTTNGKVDRKALPAFDLNISSGLKNIISPRNAYEETMHNIWLEVLRLDQISVTDNFFELGGDSIIAIQIVSRANQAGFRITPKSIFQHPAIEELVNASTENEFVTEQNEITGKVPLTPVQHWFFENDICNPSHFNQSILLEVKTELEIEILSQALNYVVRHHDALRLSFIKDENGWNQHIQPYTEKNLVLYYDFSSLEENKLSAAIEDSLNNIQSSLSIERGDLIKVGFLKLAEDKCNRLLIVVHHLCIDGVSWPILLQDIQTAYSSLVANRKVQLPLKTTSFKYWAEKQVESVSSNLFNEDTEFWKNYLDKKVMQIIDNYQPEENPEMVAHQVTADIDEETTRIITRFIQTEKINPNSLFLSCLANAFRNSDDPEKAYIPFNLESHGREEIFKEVDSSRTIGWFTSIYPVLVKPNSDENILKQIITLNEELNSIPNKGISYGILRYLSGVQYRSEIFDGLLKPQISFNYLGQLESQFNPVELFGFASEWKGYERDPHSVRPYLLEIDGGINGGKVQFEISYSGKIFNKQWIENLKESFISQMKKVSALYSESEKKDEKHQLSDFGWDKNEYDELLKSLNGLDNNEN